MAEESINQIADTIRNHANVSVELKRLGEKKSNAEQKLANLEKQIYALEGSYLQDTLQIGNILSGWEGYAPQRGAGRRPNRQFRETDRLFSLSSATSLKSNDIPVVTGVKHSLSNGKEEISNDSPHSEEDGKEKPPPKKRGRPRKIREEPPSW